MYLLCFVCFLFTACSAAKEKEQKESPSLNIIPKPLQVTQQDGFFVLNKSTAIVLSADVDSLRQEAEYLRTLLQPATGFSFPVKEQQNNAIYLQIDEAILHEEGYQLEVNKNGVTINAKTTAGIFYGIQTLRQLLPPELEKKEQQEIKWELPFCQIEDVPRYGYRGMHLDVARHFFTVEEVKNYLDIMALHKFNTFHWHLTEDQGWRIEIKKYPKLTEVGAWRKETIIGHNNTGPQTFDGKRYGGFYTQEEVKDVVAYAQKLHITIIPEIEMPGHSLAALSAYPELGCTEGPFEAATRWGIFKDVYCPKEETFQFLEDVLTEVMELFPGKYIHIGADECPKDRWKESALCQRIIEEQGLKDEHELQSYFVRRIEKFLNANGKSLVGWDEILEGGLAPNATVMSWRGTEGGIAAAKQHHDVIMTPTNYCYFDYYQAKPEGEPLAIGGYLSVDSVYGYDPTPAVLNQEEAKHILGVQGNVWTEYIKDNDYLMYMVYPRASALAEVAWSTKENKSYGDFKKRFLQFSKRLDNLGVRYAPHIVK